MAGKKENMCLASLKENILTMATFLGVLIGVHTNTSALCIVCLVHYSFLRCLPTLNLFISSIDVFKVKINLN